MPKDYDDELIKIKKKSKKEKVQKNAPKVKGVTLDFSTEEKPKFSRYYMAISRRYRLMRYLTIVVLVVFLLVMLIFYRENITYSNLMYLMKDLDTDSQINVGAYGDISYDQSFYDDFHLFRQKIAHASSKGFTLHSQTGAVDLRSEEILSDPRLETGEKYALMYDAGTTRYWMYTTIAKVLSAECEFDIEDACVSDSGRYALLTKSDESRFLVTAYSQDFTPVTEYYMDKFVIDMAMDATGENIAIASTDVSMSGVSCELLLGKVGTQEKKNFEFPGIMPLYVQYTDDGKVVMICDSEMIIFDGKKEAAHISFEGLTPGSFNIVKNTVAISFPTNVIGSENELRVYNTNGEMQFSTTIRDKVLYTVTDGATAAYAVGEGSAYRLSFGDGKCIAEMTDVIPVGAIGVSSGLIVFGPSGSTFCFYD